MGKNQITEIFIRSGSAYNALVTSLAKNLKERQLLPFLGAGISHDPPSCLPLATGPDGLIQPLQNLFLRVIDQSLEYLNADKQSICRARNVVQEAPLERLLDVLQETYGDKIFHYLEILNSNLVNPNHQIIAEFSRAGYLPLCITLNFDLLIEHAISSMNGGSYTTECPLSNCRFPEDENNPNTKVIKPHGSFVPKGVSENPFSLLSATLSKMGFYPTRPNREAITSAIESCPNLLVAGYGAGDWDIVPIIIGAGRLLRKVIWIQHIKDDELIMRRAPQRSSAIPLYERIKPWLSDHQFEAILLYGNVRYLFEDIFMHLFPNKELPPSGETRNIKPDPSIFIVDLKNPNAIKTYISLAMLPINCGFYCWSLLNWLSIHDQVMMRPWLHWKVEMLRSNAEHTRGELVESVRIMKQALKIKEEINDPDMSTAHDLVWLGYKYLCLVKSPNPLRPVLLFRTPYFLWRGYRYMKGGAIEGEKRKIEESPVLSTPQTMAHFYWADFILSLGNLFMLLGGKWRFLYRFLFIIASRCYKKISTTSNLMDDSYYFMRYLEARLLSGDKSENPDVLNSKLQEIGDTHRLTQDLVQIGNAHAYRALIFALLKGDTEAAEKELEFAEKSWSEISEEMASGRRRITLFRRFLGISGISFWDALLSVIHDKNSTQKKCNSN